LEQVGIIDETGLALDGDGDGRGSDDFAQPLIVAVAGDVNFDLKIDFADFSVLAANYDPTGRKRGNNWSKGDFDGDGDIDFSDFVALVANFSSTYGASP
jgi:hypothetical protein